MPDWIKCTLRPSDLLLSIYIAAILREFFWVIDGQWLAWTLTTLLTIVIILIHATLREPQKIAQDGSQYKNFGLVLLICAPLAIIYLLRFPFPDTNYDVLNYHLVNMERGLRGWPFIAGDFLPTTMPINPTSDIVTGITRYALGYRLGTIVNLGAMAWTASLAFNLFKGDIPKLHFRLLATAYVISTEFILYLLSTYQVDLLALPLLLEASLLAINYEHKSRKNYALIHIGLFLGIALAFKLSNLAFILPIGLLALYQAYRHGNSKTLISGVLPALAVLILPAAPYLLYIWHETGNPIYPFLNKFFHSPLWGSARLDDPFHGPKTFVEIVLWPFWVYFNPERGSEFVGGDSAYTGRIALGFIFALVSLLAPGLKPEIRKLGYIGAASTILWSVSSGNLRYGIFLEVVGGIVTLSVIAAILRTIPKDQGQRQFVQRTALFSSFAILFLLQITTSYRQAATLNQTFFGDKIQPTLFQKPQQYFSGWSFIFQDRAATSFLSGPQWSEIESVQLWVNAYPATTGFMTSLRPEIPMVSVSPFLVDVNDSDPLTTEAGRVKYAQSMAPAKGKRIYSIVRERNISGAVDNLHRAGLRATRITAFMMPFFSPDTRQMALIQIDSENEFPAPN